MNKVEIRCQKDAYAKFHFGSKRIYTELKLLKIFLYALNVVPVVFCFLDTTSDQKLICSLISFALTLLNEVLTSFITNHKEKGILLHQLYESEITGSTFSKIEYDRESTNELQELAIRKGLPSIRKEKPKNISYVPSQISDDYSYLYLCRASAATTRFVLARIIYIYIFLLIGIALVLISLTLSKSAAESLYFIVCFWPLIIPIIRDIFACKKCIKQCVKISADIDNFFADGDASIERLARFYYYVQTIEFEMMVTKPTVFKIFQAMYNHGSKILLQGVTSRFIEAINELKSKDLIAKGYVTAPKGKNLITKVEFDLDAIMEKRKQQMAKKKATSTKKSSLEVVEVDISTQKKTTAKPSTKKVATSNLNSNTSTKKVAVKKPSEVQESAVAKKQNPAKSTKTTTTTATELKKQKAETTVTAKEKKVPSQTSTVKKTTRTSSSNSTTNSAQKKATVTSNKPVSTTKKTTSIKKNNEN